jgi:large subunit ribosomal protein L29
MEAKQYREMSTEELNDKVDELSKRLFELRSQAATETLENSKSVHNIKRDIARIKTVLREKLTA